MTYWILTDKNTVIARSLLRTVEDYKINKRCIPTDSQVNSIVVKDQPKPQQEPLLALLSKITNKHSLEIDITKINGSIAQDHIGFKFIMNDIRNIPTKSKIIEVDEETGLIIVYVDGG